MIPTHKVPKLILFISILLILLGLALVIFKPKAQQISENPSPTPSTHTPTVTKLFFAGDIMLSRNVAGKIYASQDLSLPFNNIKNEINDIDIAFANLESPFNDSGSHFVEGSLVFNADPKFIEGLETSGFDILSTANNHTLDQGAYGLQYTYDLLKSHGIIPIGTTINCHDGEIITKNNIKFGFLAYSYTAYNDGGKIPDAKVCDANDLTSVNADIAKLKSSSDIVIVSLHAGVEYTDTPNKLQTDFASVASDAGADFVIGAHPHWIQKPIEKLNDKTWVFYSLGNFVFDQMWSQPTREGLTVTVTYEDQTLKSIELKPVIIDNFCCPRWADETETKNILHRLDLTSPIL